MFIFGRVSIRRLGDSVIRRHGKIVGHSYREFSLPRLVGRGVGQRSSEFAKDGPGFAAPRF